MTKRTLENYENEIAQILDSVRELLEGNYPSAARWIDDQDRIKINFAVVVETDKHGDTKAKTTCVYGRRIKHKVERFIEDPSQIKLGLDAREVTK